MSHLLVLIVLSATPTLLFAGNEEAVGVEVGELLAEPESWDGANLTVTGELVGDYSRRDDGVWVQINDDAYVRSPIGAGGVPDSVNVGLGARIPHEVFSRVEGGPGRYGRHGPVVSLQGIFRHTDPRLQGETYLDVTTVRTLRPAEQYLVPGPDLWLAIGIGLLLAAGLLRARRGSFSEAE